MDQYVPKTWTTGDIITANDLNHIESGIKTITDGVITRTPMVYSRTLLSDAAKGAGWSFYYAGTLAPIELSLNPGDVLVISGMKRTNGTTTLWLGLSSGQVTSIDDPDIIIGWSNVGGNTLSINYQFSGTAGIYYVTMGIYAAAADTLRAGTQHERYTGFSVAHFPSS